MRQVKVTIPDEYYDNLMAFLKPIPDTVVDNREEEYNRSIEKMVLERLQNSKPEDYVDAWESLKRIKEKHGF
jgi:galactose-1-phosphate uridylyltransferase